MNEPKATQMRSVQEIRDVLTEVRSFIDHEATSSASTVMGRTSRFWKELFDERQNFPTVAEFLAFRHSNFAYGMADERQGSLEHERLHAARTFDIFKHSVSPAEVAQVEEPSLGAPFVFDFGGVTRSAAFWVNAATAHRVRQCVAETSLAPRPLHVLEIGAGWGATSYQLHHLLDIDSYTIVDLPQNLLLSTTYLRNTLPDRALGLIGQDGPELSEHSHKSIVGMLPGALPRLATKYDVILNSFSLQEMDLDTVQAYFSWIEQSLSSDGIFISLNSHGKSGVRRPADYGYERFALKHIGMFRKYPSGFLNTIPYEVVASRRSDDAPSVSPISIDTLGCLYQFGLGDDLAAIAKSLIQGSRVFDPLLANLADYFDPDPSKRENALSSPLLNGHNAIRDYLLGQHNVAIGDHATGARLMRSALDASLSGFAGMRASVFEAILSKRAPVSASAATAMDIYPEVRRMIETSEIAPLVHQFNRITTLH